jgi:hypothetical protein
MKKALLLVTYWLLTHSTSGQAVKTVRDQQQAWLGYFNQTRLSNHWGFWVDAHIRRIDFMARPNQNLIRVGATYYLADNVRLTAGYALVGTYLSPSGVIRPEHRPWQQIWWTGRAGRLNLLQWVRAEQRFNRSIVGDQLAEGYNFNWRFRYNIMLQVPFKGQTIQPGVPNFVLQNEAFINAGKQITYNYFDQNRFFVGISYPFNKSLSAQLGYMNLFQQQPTGNSFVSNHTLRLFLFHSLDLRKQP